MTSPSGGRDQKQRNFLERVEGFPGWGEFDEASPNFPVEHDLERVLRRLDGTNQSYYILVMLPDGVDIDTMQRTDRDGNFMQCAGTADRLTIEHAHPDVEGLWFDTDPDAENIRDILGHTAPDPISPPEEHIPMSGGGEQIVYASEVFDAEEAVEIFAHYYRHGAPPAELHKRRVAL